MTISHGMSGEGIQQLRRYVLSSWRLKTVPALDPIRYFDMNDVI